MRNDEKSRKITEEIEDPQVDAALRSFRASVRAWSDQEFGRTRVVRAARPWYLRVFDYSYGNPVVSGALAVMLVAVAVSVPVVMHQDHEAVVARRQAAGQSSAQAAHAAQQQDAVAPESSHTAVTADNQAEDAQTAEEKTETEDDKLMSDVDSDIAQETPDAMQPLAQMMTDPTPR